MEQTKRQWITVFTVLLSTLAVAAIIYCGQTGSSSKKEEAAWKAQEIYSQKKASGMDFSHGPCIAEELMPGWSADVAHNPRQEIDNLPENQCRDYREGKTGHFVELDISGNIIKIH